MPKDAPWLPDFEHEMFSFPKGKHVDIVDSVTQFLLKQAEPPARTLDVKVTKISNGNFIIDRFAERNGEPLF